MFLSFALAWLLDEVMHSALAFFIVAALYGVAAAVLGLQASEELTDIEPLPETRASLKEDVQWAAGAEKLGMDIASERRGLAESIEAIGDRVSPGRMVERRTNRVKDRISSVKDTVMGAAPSMPSMPSMPHPGLHPGSSDGSSMPSMPSMPDVSGTTRGNPLAAGLVAFGTGLRGGDLPGHPQGGRGRPGGTRGRRAGGAGGRQGGGRRHAGARQGGRGRGQAGRHRGRRAGQAGGHGGRPSTPRRRARRPPPR